MKKLVITNIKLSPLLINDRNLSYFRARISLIPPSHTFAFIFLPPVISYIFHSSVYSTARGIVYGKNRRA